MHKMNYLDIDGQLLAVLVAVHEEQSVSKAAHRLNIHQSTLSHRLDRLRKIAGDPIFVRAGRGIIPTLRANEMVTEARHALAAMHSLSEIGKFSPAEIDDTFVIAATDYERSLFLMDAYKHITATAPQLKINFVWEKYNNTEALRKGLFDMVISPAMGDDVQDIKRRRLFHDHFRCFYNPGQITAPDSLEKYLTARHVRILFSDDDSSFVDVALQKLTFKRHVAVDIPSLSELPLLLKSNPLVATVPSRLRSPMLSGFADCPVPFKIDRLDYMLFWHVRTHMSPTHAWLRKQIIEFIEKTHKIE